MSSQCLDQRQIVQPILSSRSHCEKQQFFQAFSKATGSNYNETYYKHVFSDAISKFTSKNKKTLATSKNSNSIFSKKNRNLPPGKSTPPLKIQLFIFQTSIFRDLSFQGCKSPCSLGSLTTSFPTFSLKEPFGSTR